MLKIRILLVYIYSLIKGYLCKNKFKDIKTFCLFIGYPRSGHSLIAALLDAHPEIIIAHESHSLRHIKRGFLKYQLFYLLLRNSRKVARKGRNWSGYSYKVKNQWQGKFDKIKVLGDKRGGGSTSILQEYPHLLDELKKKINTKIKLIHVIRNPFDIISTRVKRQSYVLKNIAEKNIDEMIDIHLKQVETINQLKNSKKWDVFDLRHEDFIEDPENILSDLCNFLGVTISKDYIDNCSAIVYKEPHKSRFDISWTKEQIENVEYQIKKYSFLEGYCYKD